MLFSDEEKAWHRREVLRLSDSNQKERCRCRLRGDDSLDGSAALVAKESVTEPSGFYLPAAAHSRRAPSFGGRRRRPTGMEDVIDASAWDVDRLLRRGREILQSSSAEDLTFQRITRDIKALAPTAIDSNSLKTLFATRFLLKITERQASNILERASSTLVVCPDQIAKLAILFVPDADAPPPQSLIVQDFSSNAPQPQLQMDLGSYMMTDPPRPTETSSSKHVDHNSWAERVVPPLPPPTRAELSRLDLSKREWKENAAVRSRIQSTDRNLSSPFIY